MKKLSRRKLGLLGIIVVAVAIVATVAGAATSFINMKAGGSLKITCPTRIRVPQFDTKQINVTCDAAGGTTTTTVNPTTTTVNPTTTTTVVIPPTTTTTIPTQPPPADPTPSFVACGANKNTSMNSPLSSFAAAKTAFPNTSYVDLPAGDNSGVVGQNWQISANTTYYFEPGVHTIGGGQFAQIQAKDGDAFVGAPGAILDGQGLNNYAITAGASNVKIQYMEIRNFVSPIDQGVVNHDGGAGWTMKYNYMHDNGGAAIILADNNTAQYNCLDHNVQYGFQVFGDNVNVTFNEISRNNAGDVEGNNPGCGCSGGMKSWGGSNTVMNDNWVHGNLNVGLWIDTNTKIFDISNNVITDNTAEAIIYETSYNFRIDNNYIARNGFQKGQSNGGFPNPAVYISESGGDSRVSTKFAQSSVSNNVFVDNWGGVTLYENADRYCSSGANTSSGTCTLVNPGVANLTTCADSTKVSQQPYYDDCRWKTQNVTVAGNQFKLTQANVPNCTHANTCGFNALVSMWGSFQPYHDVAVEDHITFNQNNHFSNNTYTGYWSWQVHEQGNVVTFPTWKAAPYNQDAGSTFTP